MAEILLTVSGTIAPDLATQVQKKQRPRPDYLAMAETFGADLIDYQCARAQTGAFGALLAKIGGPNLVLAWACFQLRNHYRAIFTDGEQVGICFALLLKFADQRRARHLMIAHILSVPKKMVFFDYLKVQATIDRFFVYSSWQKRFIEERWHVDPAHVIHTPFMVDSTFFSPAAVTSEPARQICAVGLEFRDYPTLIEAVRDLDVAVTIAAASPWSKRTDTTKQVTIPAHVTVQRFSQYDLRQRYADCCFVVMPLYAVDFQAGVTAILEAMAMGKAVICTKTPGQVDVIEDGVTGIYVPPADVDALRNAITYLLENPVVAEEMGQAGRRKIEESMSLIHYTKRLEHHLRALLQPDDGNHEPKAEQRWSRADWQIAPGKEPS